MSNLLQGLKPEKVFFYFSEIAAIPHGSGNTKAISDYLVCFAKEHALRYRQDETGNVIIFKDASCGKENAPTVILQGHMDMVCDKDPSLTDFDFEKDGLRLQVNGDLLSADRTTLGGDDGIAVAFALAVLDDDSLVHPPLEVLITVDEEIGLLGAVALDASDLKGRLFLNMDSEDEGEFCVGCASGALAAVSSPLEFAEDFGLLTHLSVDGLQGGHSGAEIHHQRANAVTVLARVVDALCQKKYAQIVSMDGGKKDNAIPFHAEALLCVKPDALDFASALVNYWQDELKTEFGNVEPHLSLSWQAEHEVGKQKVLSSESAHKLITAILCLPNGIQTYSRYIDGLVQTSLNLGVMHMDENGFELSYCVRSGSSFEKEALLRRIELTAAFLNLSMRVEGSYPPWPYRADSPLRDTMVDLYREMYGAAPKVVTIHAGLECGILADKMPGLDAVSFGPNMRDVHTFKETLSISSVQRTYDFLCRLLERLAR